MKLVISRQIEFKDGLIIFFGRPFHIVPSETLASITRVMKKSKKMFRYFYLEAWKAGLLTVDLMNRKYKISTPEERYTLAMDALALAGLGTYETIRFVPGKFSHFRVFGNPLSLQFYPSKSPMDLFLRGINAGGGTIVHGRIINCIELVCAAQNGRYCEFVNGAKEVLLSREFKKITKKQFGNLNYFIKEEKKFIKNYENPSVEILE